MKVMTLLGTRPEIIRLSVIIDLLDRHCEQVLVYTGQNAGDSLSGAFFRDLGVRAPDHQLDVHSTEFGEQVGRILAAADKVLAGEQLDRFLVLGDTNSGLAAIVAARRGIPVYHLEAGNRCYDNRVPEEVNRRVIDHASDVLMPYTHRSKENLVAEGIARERVFVVGNPINEVMEHYADRIEASDVLGRLELSGGAYFLVTAHRAENVDSPERLAGVVATWDLVAQRWRQPVVVSLHPRTADRMAAAGITPDSPLVHLLEPLGFFDFGKLLRNARCTLTDSGTVQEECCILRVPSVTVRDTTERPETVECGSTILAGLEPEGVVRAVETVLDAPCDWTPPQEYLESSVSTTVMKVVLGHRDFTQPAPARAMAAERGAP